MNYTVPTPKEQGVKGEAQKCDVSCLNNIVLFKRTATAIDYRVVAKVQMCNYYHGTPQGY